MSDKITENAMRTVAYELQCFNNINREPGIWLSVSSRNNISYMRKYRAAQEKRHPKAKFRIIRITVIKTVIE